LPPPIRAEEGGGVVDQEIRVLEVGEDENVGADAREHQQARRARSTQPPVRDRPRQAERRQRERHEEQEVDRIPPGVEAEREHDQREQRGPIEPEPAHRVEREQRGGQEAEQERVRVEEHGASVRRTPAEPSRNRAASLSRRRVPVRRPAARLARPVRGSREEAAERRHVARAVDEDPLDVEDVVAGRVGAVLGGEHGTVARLLASRTISSVYQPTGQAR
jgi:hypothetical protein